MWMTAMWIRADCLKPGDLVALGDSGHLHVDRVTMEYGDVLTVLDGRLARFAANKVLEVYRA